MGVPADNQHGRGCRFYQELQEVKQNQGCRSEVRGSSKDIPLRDLQKHAERKQIVLYGKEDN